MLNTLTMNKRDQSDEYNADYELYFLIAKFLEAGPCTKSVEVLKNELCEYEILPKRYDWEGNQHDQTFDELERKFRHIGPKHLVEICHRIGPLLDKEIPPCTAGLASLLGSGRQSIMRSHKDAQRSWRTLVECSVRKHQMPLHNSVIHKNINIINVLHGRECSGPFSRKQAFTPKMYSRMQLLSRTLGHLSAVYCCLFDGTGRYVLTGADDMLIKVWSAVDGRLLATLRGVLSEVTDIAINVENTLLAAGSVDKIIRVWCLQTSFPCSEEEKGYPSKHVSKSNKVAVLIAHTGMITGVTFCPAVINGFHYLASTSTDGSVAFWSYTVGPNNIVSFHPKALQYNERMRPGQAQMICASFSPGGMFMAAGSADHHVRVYKMVSDNDMEGPHRILETEPHTDRVDSIQWAHSGLKFISGSKDGTAIIWRFTRQRWKTFVLNMSAKLSNKPEVAVDPKLKLKVTMVCWNRNDKWAITACNDNSIKVWDSESAKLFEVLHGHKEEVFVLESHPHDPNVLLTAGHDGLILLWDLLTGSQLASFQNTVENNLHGAVFDAKWSPDGSMMAATDSQGHILLFGLGFVNDKIKKLPKELFFHTDYRPLVRDESHNVLDEQTQLAPHLMPPPFLVDIDGNPYPPYLQRLVPGRESCRTEQLVPNIIMSPGGQQEVIEGLDEPRSNIDAMIQALVSRSGPDQQSSSFNTQQSTSPRSRKIFERLLASIEYKLSTE